MFGSEEWIALVQSRPQRKKWMIERLIHQLTTPEEWSDRTKQVIYLLFVGAQLKQEMSALNQRLNQVDQLKQNAKILHQEILENLPAEKFKEIEKNSALLGVLLSDKYQALLSNPNLLKKFASPESELYSVTESAIKKYGVVPPDRKSIARMQDAYKTHCIVQEASSTTSFTTLSFDDWWQIFTKPENSAPEAVQVQPQSKEISALTNKSNSKSFQLKRAETSIPPATSTASNLSGWPITLVRTIGSFLMISTTSSRTEFVEQKKNESNQQLTNAALNLSVQANRLEQEATTVIGNLREEILLLQRELIRLANTAPKDTCPLLKLAAWTQEVNDKCYAVQKLEEHIAKQMVSARQALSMELKDLEKYGKKYLNLIIQGRLVEGLQLPGIVVPIPHGLKSEETKQFLEKYAPQIFEDWNTLGKLYADYKDETPFLNQPEPKALLEKIQMQIERVFKQADERHYHELMPKEVQDWLKSVHDNQDYLMVRSTGAEDSRQTANAGGNISKAYVPSTLEGFCEASGEVVASYFSFSSLQNRINAGLNPFEQELTLSVLAQQLIGEEIGGATNPKNIPISLVLFTTEPLYVGGEKFRVMRMSATYGHGEGVVGAQGIATDTALLLISEKHPDRLYVMYDNKEKTERLAPISTPEGIILGKLPNSPHMAKRPALSEELLRRLYVWGIVGEKLFEDYPTDMEIVVKNGIIYPVQARPINRPDLLPTYLDLKKIAALEKSPIQKTIQGEMLVPGKASVVTIKDPKEIHFAASLGEAEKGYIKGQHKLVVVTEGEPSNSHPVVNFSSLGMPCLIVDSQATIDNLKEQINENRPLVVCMQTSTLNLFEGEATPYISSGFAVHPAKIAISLPLDEVSTPKSQMAPVPQDVKDMVLGIRSAATHKAALPILKELRQHKWIQNVKQRRSDLKEYLKHHQVVPPEIARTYSIFKELDHRIDQAFEEAEAAFSSSAQTERLRPLLHVKVLEQLLIVKAAKGESLGQYSLLEVEDLYQEAEALINYQKKFNFPCRLTDLLLASSKAYSPSSHEEWQNFLEQLEILVENGKISSEQVTLLRTFIHRLNKLDLSGAWFTMFFKPVSSAEETLKLILEALPQENETIIEDALKLHRTFERSHSQINRFADRRQFQLAWQELQSYARALSEKGGLQEQFKAVAPMTKTILLKTMDELVELYDTSIKTMKASSDWSPEEKTKLFKEMLVPYFSLLEVWSVDLIESDDIPIHDEWTVGRYLEMMKETITNIPDTDPRQLFPTADFSVSAAKLGAQTAFLRHLPGSLEDGFTLIHQNLREFLTRSGAKVYTADVLNQSALPNDLKHALQSISKGLQRPFQCVFEIKNEGITVKYNVPLRNHSAQLTLVYDKATGKIVLKSHFFGDARNRWGLFRDLGVLLNNMGILNLDSSIVIGEQEINLAWIMGDQESYVIALNEFEGMCETSLLNDNLSRIEYLTPLIERYVTDANLQKVLETFYSKEGFSDGFLMMLEILLRNHLGYGETLAILRKNVLEANLYVNELGLRRTVELLLKENDLLQEEKHVAEDLLSLAQFGLSLDGFSKIHSLIILKGLVASGKGISEALAAAKSGINDSDTNVFKQSLEIFIELIRNRHYSSLDEKQRCFIAAKEAALKGISDENPVNRRVSIQLIHSLIVIDLNLDYNAAISVAVKGLRDTDDEIRLGSIRIFDRLANEVNIQSYISLISKGMDDANTEIRQETLELFSSLKSKIEKDEVMKVAGKGISDIEWDIFTISKRLFLFFMNQEIGYDEAIQAAKEGMAKTDPASQYHALEFFYELIVRDKGFQESAEAAKRALLSNEVYLRETAIKIFQALFEKEKGYEEALAAANEGMSSLDKEVRDDSLNLFIELIQRERNFDEALIAAEKGLGDLKLEPTAFRIFEIFLSKGVYIRESILIAKRKMNFALFQKLIKHDLGLIESIEAVSSWIQNEDFTVKLNSLKLLTSLIDKNHGVQEAIAAASRGIEDNDIIICRESFGLFEKLIRKGLGYQEAIRGATKGLENSNDEVREESISLFKALVELDQGYPEAIQAASKGLKDSNVEIHAASFELFERLVDKGQGYQEAIQSTSHEIHNSDSIQWKLVSLFKKIVKAGQGYQEAIKVASEGFKNSDNSSTREEYIKLFTELVKQKQGFQEAIEAASEGVKDESYPMIWKSLYLFKMLIEMDQGYQEAIKVASEGFKTDRDSYTREQYIELFTELVKRGQGYQEAIKAASQGIKEVRHEMIWKSFNLFKSLVEMDQGYQEAIKAASEGFKTNDDSFMRQQYIELFAELVKRGQGYQEAKSVASEGVMSSEYDVRVNSLILFFELVIKGHGYDEAVQAAALGLEDEDRYIRKLSSQLFQELVSKGHGIKESKMILERAKANSQVDDEIEALAKTLKSIL